MIALIVAAALGILALAFVLYPLYQPALRAVSGRSLAEEGLIAEKERNARTALQEVELDYQLGNITEKDYKDLRERYMQRALVALKARYEREQEIDDEIEEQLRKLKDNHEKADT
ncbi:MAG: hypothetical protein J2P36_12270 [Ktedonobacteraceae bacterium]|nr:hypothetical protein [Ktedonobacteraceae bacterium]